MNIQYIAFSDSIFGKHEPYVIYKYDGKGWYVRDGGKGFDVATVNRYSSDSLRFLRAETLDGINEEIRKANHIHKYGYGIDGDVACPKCGYKYSLEYYDHNDGYYTPAIIEDFSTVITCICGCKFESNVVVDVKFTTKIIS